MIPGTQEWVKTKWGAHKKRRVRITRGDRWVACGIVRNVGLDEIQGRYWPGRCVEATFMAKFM